MRIRNWALTLPPARSEKTVDAVPVRPGPKIDAVGHGLAAPREKIGGMLQNPSFMHFCEMVGNSLVFFREDTTRGIDQHTAVSHKLSGFGEILLLQLGKP